jgi:hypothetical protein
MEINALMVTVLSILAVACFMLWLALFILLCIASVFFCMLCHDVKPPFHFVSMLISGE